MKIKHFPAKEMAFKEKDGTFYAVSISFGLYAEGDSLIDVFNKLHEATVGYLTMCIKENESEEDIYRGVKKQYQDMYDSFLSIQHDTMPQVKLRTSLVKKTPMIKMEDYSDSVKRELALA